MSSVTSTDQTLRPWQFFLLAGMLSATAVVIAATGQSPASIIILSVTVVATSLVSLGVYRLLTPLVVPVSPDVAPLIAGRTRAAIEREKILVLRSIKELEFDFAMRKISQADYDEMAGRLRARAIGLIRQLDAGAGYKTEIDREIERRLGAAASATIVHAAGEDAGEGAPRPESSSGRPCVCGMVNDPDARFCKDCGTRLAS